MNKPKVSIIVTAHNNAEYLPKCLDALLQQTLVDIEILAFDDASDDNSAQIIRDYAQKSSKIHAHINKKNLGVSATRNQGIKLAQAPFVMFCDGDDYYDPNACQALYDAITGHAADLAVGELKVIYHAHAEMKPSDDNYYALGYHGRQVASDDVIYNTDLAPTNKIFRKSILTASQIEFPKDLRFEDAYFCVAYMCACQTIYFVSQVVYYYVRHAKSLMSSTWDNANAENDPAIDHLYIAFRLYEYLEKHQLLERYNDLYWRLFEAFTDFALRNSKSRTRVRQVKSEAKQFIAKHQASFDTTTVSTQENIRRLVSGKFYFSAARIKRTLIKFFPTYRLTVTNLQNLQHLKQKQQQLNTAINELTKGES